MCFPVAISSSAFHSAARYFITGLSLLGNDSWDRHYNLSIGLYDAASEALYVTGDFSRLTALVQQPLKFARSFEDKLNIYNNLVRSFLASGQLEQGISTCMSVLAQLGEVIPAQITPEIFHVEVVRIKTIIGGMTNEQLLSLPIMTDSNKLVSEVSCFSIKLLTHLPDFILCTFSGHNAILESSSLPSLYCCKTGHGSHHCIQNG